MTREQLVTVRFGHRLIYSGETLIAIEYGKDNTGNVIKCVAECNYKRWRLIRAWDQGGVLKDKPEDEQKKLLAEKESYEGIYPAEKLESGERVKICKGYDTLFEIGNFGLITVNGEERRVVFIDDYHFELTHPVSGWGSIYHIHEFGEAVIKHNVAVKPQAEYTAGLLDSFLQGFDQYDYSDCVENSEENIRQIMENLEEGTVNDYTEFLAEVITEKEGDKEDRLSAMRLIPLLNAFRNEVAV